MLNEIKEQLINSPEKLVELLEDFGFERINHRGNEIRLARDWQGGSNISIRLKNNPYCCVSDWSRGINTDIISYIIQEKNVEFREVLQATKKILGLGNDWRPQQKKVLFAGIYQNIINNSQDIVVKTYEESILNQYLRVGNKLWLDDGISLEIQKEFNILFDVYDNSIVIPWRNQFGEIIAIKNRVNGNPEEGMSKYYFSIGGYISSSLYGYSENFSYLQNTDVFIGESEKQVLQLATKGYRNAISLGSNSLSSQQAKLILSLNPKKIIWLLDEGLPKENTLRNAKIIKDYCVMKQVEQYWWDWENSLSVESGSKISPGDCSKEVFEDILKYELEKLE